ncbi:MAG TPA: phosphotransferase [Chloroflexia bacterium]|nr:phosphotransferase [Chloroflexia bacterium]
MNAEDCRQLLQCHFPHLKVSTVSPALESMDYAVFCVNERCIFRFAERPDVRAKLHKEVRLLPELAQTVSISVPRFEFIYLSQNVSDVEFVGYDKIDGVPLTPAHMGGQHTPQLAGQLAALLREIHAFPQQVALGLAVPHFTAAAWRGYYRDFFLHIQAEVVRVLDRDTSLQVSQLWNEYLRDDTNFAFVPVLIHGDLVSPHILANIEGTAIAGIIDWADAAIGDPAFDFARILTEYGERTTQRILDEYRAFDEPFLRRMRFYAMAMPFNKIAFGLLHGRESMVQVGIEHLKARLNRWAGIL